MLGPAYQVIAAVTGTSVNLADLKAADRTGTAASLSVHEDRMMMMMVIE